jgi:hypothetical protein
MIYFTVIFLLFYSCAQFANSGFVVSIAQRNKILVFEPTFNSYHSTLLNVYNMMIAAVKNLPCLETKLYLDWGGPQMVLKVCFMCLLWLQPL